ncbi:Kelch repeat-containing protein [Nitrosomonas ureae]|uniref:N-acetylneuraminic acid mutarotase n=1 Tax=Nitrosomonas ureae TaxID=44577 RepID=A0A1H9B7E6_9PROT|nr:kelch repeat-containing protein [Nitrosomonas ureae]SEP84657.1 N-acetylneuraminic acid mutarotase [Nitrosomonas ureae]
MSKLKFLITLLVFSNTILAHAESASHGVWHNAASTLEKRTEIAAAPLDGKIYAVGGFSQPSLSNVLDFAVSRIVEVYDPATDTWTETTPLPEGRHHAGIAALDGYLYVIGGFTKGGLSVWRAVATLYQFNPVNQTWRELKPMPTARGALGVTVYQGRLYAIGGYDGDNNSAAVEVFDPQTNIWTSVAAMPTARDHLAVVTASDKIYAIGGRPSLNYRKNMDVVEVYDSATNQWHSRAKLPTARSGIAAGVIDGRIYVVGGESNEGTFNTHEMYLPDEDRWVVLPSMPTARHGLGAAVVNGRLHVISGGLTPGASFSQVHEVFTPTR